MAGPFSGLRVLELGGHAQLAGKLLGDLGANVVKVEGPTARAGSTQSNARRPDYPDLVFWALNTSKRAVSLDLGSADGRDTLARVCESADVLLDGLGAGSLERYSLDPERLRAANPRLVVLRSSAFGQDGPWSAHRGRVTSYQWLLAA